jgi:hypothetical protein
MFFRWLTEELPREMRRGWLLIKADLTFWCAVAAALALLAVSPLWTQQDEESRGAALVVLVAATVVRVALAPLLLVTAALRFDAVSSGTQIAGNVLWRTVLRRLVAVLVAWLTAAVLCRAVALVAQAVLVAVLHASATPMTAVRAWSGLVGWLVYVGLLARFAFVPFLVGLDARPAARPPEGAVFELVYRFAWPLIESNRMTRDVRSRLVPYLAIGLFAPAVAAFAPGLLRPLLSFGLHLLSFTALAVVFRYYEEQRRTA